MEKSGNKCIVREIHLATFDVIMLKRFYWRRAKSKSKSWGFCLWFCHSHIVTVITVISSGTIHTKNVHTYGPFQYCGCWCQEILNYIIIHNTVKMCFLSLHRARAVQGGGASRSGSCPASPSCGRRGWGGHVNGAAFCGPPGRLQDRQGQSESQ